MYSCCIIIVFTRFAAVIINGQIEERYRPDISLLLVLFTSISLDCILNVRRRPFRGTLCDQDVLFV